MIRSLGYIFSVWLLSIPTLLAHTPPDMASKAQITALILKEANNPPFKMTLRDSVLLALRYNRYIQSSYLDRLVQKYDFTVAKRLFWPKLELLAKNSNEPVKITDKTQINGIIAGGANIKQILPMGTELNFAWSNQMSTLDYQQKDAAYDTGVSLEIMQPLLKGGGLLPTMSNLLNAKIQNHINSLALKNNLISTITNVIVTYLNFLQADEQLKLTEQSLKEAEEQLRINKLLVEAGRMAKMDLVQTEANIAEFGVNYIAMRNNRDAARLNLLKVLDIDIHTQIDPVNDLTIKEIKPDLVHCVDLAFKNRPDYLELLLTKRLIEIQEKLAHNNMLWDLSLTARYSLQGTGSKYSLAYDALKEGKNATWASGLNLHIPITSDFTRYQNLLRAQTDVQKNKLDLQELQANVQIDVLDALRNVEMRLQEFSLTKKAVLLSKQKMAIEQTKLKIGRSSNFQIVSFQNDLFRAQNQELSAMIAYLIAEANLDQVLGTTLNTWEITLKDSGRVVEP